MGRTWSPETERTLLVAIAVEADHKPTADVWNRVAQRMGGGLTASAVSYCFQHPCTEIWLTLLFLK